MNTCEVDNIISYDFWKLKEILGRNIELNIRFQTNLININNTFYLNNVSYIFVCELNNSGEIYLEFQNEQKEPIGGLKVKEGQRLEINKKETMLLLK